MEQRPVLLSIYLIAVESAQKRVYLDVAVVLVMCSAIIAPRDTKIEIQTSILDTRFVFLCMNIVGYFINL